MDSSLLTALVVPIFRELCVFLLWGFLALNLMRLIDFMLVTLWEFVAACFDGVKAARRMPPAIDTRRNPA